VSAINNKVTLHSMISQKETTNTTHTPMTSFQAMCTCPESVKKKKKKKKKKKF